MIIKRRRVKQTETLTERLRKIAAEAREQARRLPLGKARDALMKKARQTEVASQIDEWLTSSNGATPSKRSRPCLGEVPQ
jgi:16S rRNA U1498 N3-methylase RsmE